MKKNCINEDRAICVLIWWQISYHATTMLTYANLHHDIPWSHTQYTTSLSPSTCKKCCKRSKIDEATALQSLMLRQMSFKACTCRALPSLTFVFCQHIMHRTVAHDVMYHCVSRVTDMTFAYYSHHGWRSWRNCMWWSDIATPTCTFTLAGTYLHHRNTFNIYW